MCKAGSISLLSISFICFYSISFLILKAGLKAFYFDIEGENDDDDDKNDGDEAFIVFVVLFEC